MTETRLGGFKNTEWRESRNTFILSESIATKLEMSQKIKPGKAFLECPALAGHRVSGKTISFLLVRLKANIPSFLFGLIFRRSFLLLSLISTYLFISSTQTKNTIDIIVKFNYISLSRRKNKENKDYMVWTEMIQKTIQTFLLVGLFLLLFSPSAFSGMGFRSDIALVSRYIWRGFDTIRDDHPALQPSFTFNFGESGVWFNLWSAIALADTHFVELDLIAGYDKTISNKLAFSTGAGYFTFAHRPHWPDKNSTTPEVYIGMTFNSLPLSPALNFYYGFNQADGFYTNFSLIRNFHIRGKTFCPTLAFGYTTQFKKFGVNQGFSDICLGISTDLSFENITLTPCLNYVIVPNRSINKEDEIWVGLSIGWSTDGAD